ncbi:MAG: EutN/CcmL family microcompartment protein [Candidatus Erginobacter occultus]|nr:EutN/CcmL family microcompartment protein [Candidatus Erginobacter occultus]
MKIAKIIGTVVSTLKLEQYTGEKMLLARILNPDGSDTPETVIAFDRCQAGEGDVVLMIDEGNSARQTLQAGPTGVVRAVCVGYIDAVHIHKSPAASFGA